MHWADVPQAELARAWFEDDLVLAVSGSQLPCDLLRTIRTVVVDNDHLPSKVTTLFQTIHQRFPRARASNVRAYVRTRGVPSVKNRKADGPNALFSEDFGEQPHDDGEVFALFVSGEDDGVLVGIWGNVLALHVQSGVALKRIHWRSRSRSRVWRVSLEYGFVMSYS